MLGHKLVQVLSKRFDTRCTIRGDYSQFEQLGVFSSKTVITGVDATDISTVRYAIERSKPEIVVNAIGVIKQLPASKDVVRTLSTNSIFPHLVAGLAGEYGFRFITLSTDCVFAGSKGMYSEADVPDATDLYGRSKQFGEVDGTNCLTLRTSIIGREIGASHSLVDWFLQQTGSVRGYANAIYSGFPTLILAELIVGIILDHPDLHGLYHVSSDPISKYDLLSLVKQRRGMDIEIELDTEVKIDRSLNSSRFRETTGFTPLPWTEMVDRMLSDPTPYDEWRNKLI